MAGIQRMVTSVYIPFNLRVAWTKPGWGVTIHTPLFGFSFNRNFVCFDRDGISTRVWFGLVVRIPANEGGYIYVWQWQKEFSFKPAREFV